MARLLEGYKSYSKFIKFIEESEKSSEKRGQELYDSLCIPAFTEKFF